MASVTVELPAVLTQAERVEQAILAGGRVGMQDELEIIVTEIKSDPRLPHNLGVLQRSIEATPPAQVGGGLVAWIIAAGEAAAYAAVMDLGRRPGQRMSWKFLYYQPGLIGNRDAWRGGWVNRARRDWVLEVAASLRAQDQAKGGGRRRSGRTVKQDAYERRAAYILAVSIANRIRRSGIRGRQFANSRRKEIADRVTASCAREINLALARLGAA